MACQIRQLDEHGDEVSRFWVESDVVRLGSDPKCQIRIASLPDHAATLQFKEGEYWLINRSTDAMNLNGGVVKPGQMAAWLENTLLRLNGVGGLQLLFSDDDPMPRPHPTSRGFYEIDEPEGSLHDSPHALADADADVAAPVRSPGKTVKDAVQIGVTVLCLAAAAALLLFGNQVDTTPATPLPPYGEIIEELMSGEEENPALRDARVALQDARRFELTEHTDLAVQAYTRARDLLRQQAKEEQPLEFATPAETHAYLFAVQQIRVL